MRELCVEALPTRLRCLGVPCVHRRVGVGIGRGCGQARSQEPLPRCRWSYCCHCHCRWHCSDCDGDSLLGCLYLHRGVYVLMERTKIGGRNGGIGRAFLPSLCLCCCVGRRGDMKGWRGKEHRWWRVHGHYSLWPLLPSGDGH